MLSPADTTTVFGFAARRFLMSSARYATPPATAQLLAAVHAASELANPTRPLDPDGGFRLPWKSLIARTWTSTLLGLLSGFPASALAGNAVSNAVTANAVKTADRGRWRTRPIKDCD